MDRWIVGDRQLALIDAVVTDKTDQGYAINTRIDRLQITYTDNNGSKIVALSDELKFRDFYVFGKGPLFVCKFYEIWPYFTQI